MSTGEIKLKVSNLTKHFGDVKAVNDLSFSVRQGEVYGFLGPNGAGKTTSIKMICGLLEPDQGTIAFSHQGNFHIGVAPQDNVIWNYLTVEEQLKFIARLYHVPGADVNPRVNSLLDKLGLLAKKKKLAKTLSGGMKRRLNIALALIHDPELIVLDEPEAGLDPQSRILVRSFIKSLAQEKTIIFTTHNMDEADRICDRVAIIDQGTLLVADSPRNLKQKVSEGDIIEVIYPEASNIDALKKQLISTLKEKLIRFNVIHERIQLVCRDSVQNFNIICDILKNFKIMRSDINLRWVSLEDVFIDLTGRSLRE